ncbi:unnamed protein product, partial [Mesorhabditis spiculigera]
MLFYFIALFNCLVLVKNVISAEPLCHDLTRCAMNKCIKPLPQPFPAKENLLEFLLHHANFACVFGSACQEACRKCPHCKYTQDQIKHFVLNQKTDGLCPNLEACAQRCVKEEIATDPFGCVFKRNCAKYCYDESECAPCYQTVKRVFTGVCKKHLFDEAYNQKCRPLYEDSAKFLVSRVKKLYK